MHRIVLAARAGGGEARVVGGAVRDTLLGRAIGEIDFAATLPPEKMAEQLARDGIKTVPTGIDFGTITAVIDGKGYEITTLRHDVETDGRRARVAYHDDWQADAARRDFTMNALYLDADGKLYDYFGGQDDLAAGKVRFIGDARARIREDILRILRFFRFHAWFGRDGIDTEGLSACRELAGLMPQLSMERVWREIVKLLAADNPAPSWRLMLDNEILTAILPEANDIALLESLLAVEKRHEAPSDSLRRLAALVTESPSRLREGSGVGKDVDGSSQNFKDHEEKQTPRPPSIPPASGKEEKIVASISQKLKLSRRESAKLMQLASLPVRLQGKLDPVPFRRALYEFGEDNARDAALLYAAAHPDADIEPALEAAALWNSPVFPLQGQDLLKLGAKQGPAMGEILRAIEEEWIASDFKLSREECVALAKKKLST